MLGDTGDRGAPRRRALRAPGRPRDRAAAGRPRDPGGGRRARRPEFRHRRGEGHPGARPERLRDRPPARPADADDHGRVRRGSPDTGTEFDGLDRFEARVAVREALRAAGPDRRREAAVPCTPSGTAQRSKEPIEPRLSPAVVRQGRAAGHRRPATRCATAGSPSTRRSWSRAGSAGWTTCTTGASPASCGGGTGSRSGTGPTARSVCLGPDERAARRGWTQDEDVLDTWFSSALWPFSTLGWPDADRRTWSASTRTRCWSPATTSCSSGSPG